MYTNQRVRIPGGGFTSLSFLFLGNLTQDFGSRALLLGSSSKIKRARQSPFRCHILIYYTLTRFRYTFGFIFEIPFFVLDARRADVCARRDASPQKK